MRVHEWSKPVPFYEGVDLYKCRFCGAVVMSIDYPGPTVADLDKQKVPIDCDESVFVVIHEAYDGGELDPWDEDEEFQWV